MHSSLLEYKAMKKYTPKEIEGKWQQTWQDNKTYEVDLQSKKPKYFGFSMFNYPSGAGIHIGHALTYTISDVKARFKRQQGYESYHPVGWDSFGLPAENYAIKAGVSPQQSMSTIIPSYHKQYQAMGWSNDWSKEIATHKPEYYKWTQWLFVKMHEEGLAYQDAREQWFCELCQTVLSDAQVIEGKCWRHDGADDPIVGKKEIKQWFFKITDYADELLDATADLDWTPSVKLAQQNWIGRSEGAIVSFDLVGSQEKIDVFTTAYDTIYGTTFMVVAPEHEIVKKITIDENREKVEAYVHKAANKTEVERQANKDKTGVFTGAYAVNPVNKAEIPIWVADYVLVDYGTGAVMAVPGEDERDFEFAGKFDIPVIFTTKQQEFVSYQDINATPKDYEVANSDEFDGMNFEEVKPKILDKLVGLGAAKTQVNYKMRDWSVARQRYWGAPVPVVNCTSCYKPRTDAVCTIDYAHHEGFVWAKEGKKTVLTRAKTSELAAVKSGDLIKFVDNSTKEEVYAKAGVTAEFSDVNDLFENSDYPSKTFKKDFESVEELKNEYNSNRKDYSSELDSSGIIVIEFTVQKEPIVLTEDRLPVILPELDDFAPSGDGRSALARAEDWLKVDCPDCGGQAERETDTLDTYVCSSWYMMRYLSPGDSTQSIDPKITKNWWNVDFYNGADHATAHLLYARFISRFLHKQGYLPEPEPFKNFLFNGKLTAKDGTMFSKSKGNGVDPMEIIEQGYGADALRTYLMFAAPLDQWVRWDPQGVPGSYRFLGRVWNLVQEFTDSRDSGVESQTADIEGLSKAAHKAIKKVTEDIESSKYNTAIAAMMTCTNEFHKIKETHGLVAGPAWKEALETLVQLVAPFAPHMADELWSQLGHEDSVHVDHWPELDESNLVEDTMTIVVQVNGKVRANVQVAVDAEEADVLAAARADENITKHLDGQKEKRAIYVAGRLVNFVV